MRKRIQTALVTAEHPYTRSSEPWRSDVYTEAHGETSSGKKYGWRLFHYLSSGGMSAFGRTLQQEIRSRRQTRFLMIAAVLAVVWLCLLVG